MKNIVFTFIAALFCASCVTTGGSQGNGVDFTGPFLQYDSVWATAQSYSDKVEIKYAKGLKVDYRKDGVHVFISNPDPKASNRMTEEIVVKTKKNRFICTTALQLGNFEILGMEKYIVGCNSLKNVFSPVIKRQMQDGTTKRIGKEGNFDIEEIIAAKPDYIFVSASKYGGFESLKECNIPLIPHHGYKETNPLGQAEWIKLIGLLTGETRRANAVFNNIEKRYFALKEKVSQCVKDKQRPTVLSGRQVRDGWYVMGGRSYMAQIFADAGAEYIMEDNEETGGVTLDFESVYAKSIHADYWQMDGTMDDEFTLSDLTVEDSRYADVKAYKIAGHCLFCNFSKTPYRELGGMEPHILLADFVKAFHPELLPDYQPKYYKAMR